MAFLAPQVDDRWLKRLCCLEMGPLAFFHGPEVNANLHHRVLWDGCPGKVKSGQGAARARPQPLPCPPAAILPEESSAKNSVSSRCRPV